MQRSSFHPPILPLFACLALFSQTPAAQNPPAAAPQQPRTAGPSAPAPPGLRVVILDPAHGGTDAGARGPNNVLEKDLVLSLARSIRGELEKQGWQVILTRDGDAGHSFDERSILANAQRNAVFFTLHVASTGRAGTVRAYYAALPAPEEKPERPGLLRWEAAQAPYAEQSRRLAELLQVQLGAKFRGSPEVPAAAAVRQLQTVMAPAVAVEISSVSTDAPAIQGMAADLAAAIARAADSFRPLYKAGGR